MKNFETGRFFAALGMTMLSFFAATIAAHAQEAVSPQGALMVANVAGECDILYSMIDFEKKTNINGGDEYVAKFWAAEAAKLSLTVEQLSDRCNKSVMAYDKLWSSATQQQGAPANGNQ